MNNFDRPLIYEERQDANNPTERQSRTPTVIASRPTGSMDESSAYSQSHAMLIPPEDAASDQRTLERIISGDTTAFWEAWLRHENYIKQICRRAGGDEDDLHDVMLKLMAKLPMHASGVSNLRAWMGKLAQNFCIDRHRSLRRQISIVSLDEAEPAPFQSNHEHLLGTHSIESALEKMPHGMREVFDLRFIKGLSYKEIAERLKLTEAGIRKRIERARRRLHLELGNGSRPAIKRRTSATESETIGSGFGADVTYVTIRSSY